MLVSLTCGIGHKVAWTGKRGHHRASRGAGPKYFSGLAELVMMAKSDDDENMTKVPLA